MNGRGWVFLIPNTKVINEIPTIEIKSIYYCRNTIPEEQIHPLRQQLIELLCRYATSISNATVVVTKLCLSLTSYALHAAPNYWPNFVQDFTSTIRSAQTNLASTHEQRIGLELVLLEFLTLLPEEIGRAELIATRRVQLNTELSKSIQFVLELLESALQTPEQGGPVELSILKKFKSKALQCLQSWIVYGVPLQWVYFHISQSIESQC